MCQLLIGSLHGGFTCLFSASLQSPGEEPFWVPLLGGLWASDALSLTTWPLTVRGERALCVAAIMEQAPVVASVR